MENKRYTYNIQYLLKKIIKDYINKYSLHVSTGASVSKVVDGDETGTFTSKVVDGNEIAAAFKCVFKC